MNLTLSETNTMKTYQKIFNGSELSKQYLTAEEMLADTQFMEKIKGTEGEYFKYVEYENIKRERQNDN